MAGHARLSGLEVKAGQGAGGRAGGSRGNRCKLNDAGNSDRKRRNVRVRCTVVLRACTSLLSGKIRRQT